MNKKGKVEKPFKLRRIHSEDNLPYHLTASKSKTKKPYRQLKSVIKTERFRDIAKREILNQKKRYRLLFENLNSGYILLDILYNCDGYPIDHRLVDANTEFENLTGLKRSEEIGRTATVLNIKWPSSILCTYYEVAQTREPIHHECYNDSIGKHLDVWVSSPSEGQIAILFNDIGERKANEEWITILSNVVEQSPLFILIADPEQNIVYVNKRFTEFSQYSLEELRGKRPWVFNPAHWDDTTYQTMWGVLNSGDVWQIDALNRKKDHTPFWEHITVFPLIGKLGKLSNFIIINEDITSRMHFYDELMASKLKAEESDSLKSAFLANMSHEIRTPLNCISGFTSLLLDTTICGDEKNEYIQLIHENVDNLISIINDILDYSQIEAGHITIKNENFSIQQIFSELRDKFTLTCNNKGLTIKHSYPEIEYLIYGDINRTKQILNNLVENAIKFTEQGYIELGYQIKDKKAIIFVKDTGIGISTEFHHQIFERFRQVEQAYTRKYGGNGLGLSIARQLAERMGGTITLESEFGIGSTFYLTLPISETQDECNNQVYGKNKRSYPYRYI